MTDTPAAQSLALWAGVTAATMTTIRNLDAGKGLQLRPFIGAGVVIIALSLVAIPAPQVAKPAAGLVIIGTLAQALPAIVHISTALTGKKAP